MKCPVNWLSYLQEIIDSGSSNGTAFTMSTTFEDLGMDSYEIVDFLLKVEEKFDVVIADEQMFTIRNMKDVLDIISEGCKEELTNA